MTENPEPPTVVAVVLNWRDAPSTRQCVGSLLADPGISQVIAVDNESEGALRPLQGPRVHLIELAENRGFACGVNVGLRAALEGGADAVLVINNDAELTTGALSRLIGVWQRGGDGVGLLAPTVVYPDGSLQSTGGSLRPITAGTDDLSSDSPDYLTWACVLVPRETLEEVGLLDESFFMYWEDVDYGLRVRDAQRLLIVVDDARVIHQRSKSHGSAGSAIDRYSASGLVTLARKRRGLLLVGAPIRILARASRRLLQGRTANVRAVVSGAWHGLRQPLPL